MDNLLVYLAIYPIPSLPDYGASKDGKIWSKKPRKGEGAKWRLLRVSIEVNEAIKLNIPVFYGMSWKGSCDQFLEARKYGKIVKRFTEVASDETRRLQERCGLARQAGATKEKAS